MKLPSSPPKSARCAMSATCRRRGPLVRGVVGALQPAALAEAERRAAERVAAALGQDVDEPARHAAVLGRQPAGLDLDLLDEVGVHRLALVAELDAGRVQAVDDVLIFGAARPVELRTDGVVDDARREPRQVDEVAPHRQLVEEVGRDVYTGRVRGRVNRRRLRRDRDALGNPGEIQLHRQADRLVQADVDVGLLVVLEARQLRLHRVASGRQARESEVPL